MTDRRDINYSENSSAENTAADEIAKLYHTISTEQPSLRADEKILAMAKKSAAQLQPTRSHWVKRWSTPVSIAAVLVLSVSIVSIIKQESLRAPDFSTTDSVPLSETKAEARQERNIVSSPARSRPQPKPPASLDLSAEESSSAAATVQKKDVQAKDKVPRESAVRKRSIEKERNTIARQSKAKPLAGALSQSESEQKSATMAAPMLESAMIEDTMILKKESDAVVEKQTSVASTFSAQPQAIANKLLKQKPTAALIPALNLTSESSKALCAKTSAAKCLNSTQCMLVIAESGLRCRAAQNHCEANFSQREENAERCQLRANCDYRPGKCQCDEDDECQCGKIGPPLCEPMRYLKQD